MSDRARATAWIEVARREDVARELEGLFARVANAVAERMPVCVASGRCCHFDAYGHRLYVTGLEAAYTVVRAGRATSEALASAVERGTCPYLVGTLCGVHGVKPIGCRVYFCDPTAQVWQQELYEELLRDLRAMHERQGIEYVYGEWRGLLGMFEGVDGASLGSWRAEEPPGMGITINGEPFS